MRLQYTIECFCQSILANFYDGNYSVECSEWRILEVAGESLMNVLHTYWQILFPTVFLGGPFVAALILYLLNKGKQIPGTKKLAGSYRTDKIGLGDPALDSVNEKMHPTPQSYFDWVVVIYEWYWSGFTILCLLFVAVFFVYGCAGTILRW